MQSYLIQLTHEDEHSACVRALHAVEQYGSHLITHAHWGCKDGVHTGWMIAELLSRDDALLMVPPEFRSEATVTEVERMTGADIAALVAELEE
jgi:hypothetical protein